MMHEERYRGILIADFNARNFAAYLTNDPNLPSVEAIAAPFGQVIPSLIDNNWDLWRSKPDFAVIWTQPESVIESFNLVLNHKSVSLDLVLAQVAEYASRIVNLQDRVRHLFVPTWVFPSYRRDFGIFDLTSDAGASNILMRMNLRLAESLASSTNIYVLNSQQWIDVIGKKAFSSKLWYMAKIPFSNEVFIEATQDIKAALLGIIGQAKKLIVLDLDYTLWGGILGEVGWENLTLGGHDHLGESYVDFQRALKALTNRGILLGIVSKNEEAHALEAITKHPEMILKLEDFAGWEINWQDKAQNIVNLVTRLNLGIESVVFIDDDPVERARVREALPQVLVPEWPSEAMLFKSVLLSLRCFYTRSLNREDLGRSKMYDLEKQRRDLKRDVGSLEEWLHTLKISVTVERLTKRNLSRATQLLNKTNQMNLTTRRMSESEIMSWAAESHHALWTFSVADKFGDLGLTGIASLEVANKRGRIVDFVLSCRVMGRHIEEVLFYTVIQHARSLGLSEVYAQYIPTARNGPCLTFLKQSGFLYNGIDTFVWRVKDAYHLPRQIHVITTATN